MAELHPRDVLDIYVGFFRLSLGTNRVSWD